MVQVTAMCVYIGRILKFQMTAVSQNSKVRLFAEMEVKKFPQYTPSVIALSKLILIDQLMSVAAAYFSRLPSNTVAN
jgi:hypothetical protein